MVSQTKAPYRGEPNGTDFFTTQEAIESSGYNAAELFKGLQVQEHKLYGYRTEMGGYVFTENISTANASTLANPQFGAGGLEQIYVPNANELIEQKVLIRVDTIKLNK